MAPVRDAVLLAALLCSGCAALGYEIVWTRLCIPMLGSETLGVLATLAGFFGGMALGAALLHRRATTGRDPIGLFVRLELGAAAFAVVSPQLLHALGSAIPAWLGPWAGDNSDSTALALAIAVAGVLMIPGTLCMGATLAAVTEARRRVCEGDDDGRGVGRLYAANTAGAVLGVLGTIHVVVPMLGLGWGALVLAAIGACAALLARRWGRAHPAQTAVPQAETRAVQIDASRDPDPDAGERLPLLVLIGGTGLVGVGFEVVGVLVLSQLFENTIYTFANVLAVYLGGTALGAWAWGRLGPRLAKGRPSTAAAALLVASALSVVVASFAIVGAEATLEAVAPEGSTFAMHLLGEAVVAITVFALPTVLMGALFSHAMGLVAPGGLGHAYAINTLGGAIAPFVFGVWAPGAFGYRDAFFAVAYGYLLVFGLFTWFRRFKPAVQITAILGVIGATVVAPTSLVLTDVDTGWKVIAEHQTAAGLVVVSERVPTAAEQQARPKPPRERRLQIGKHFRMGGRFAFAEHRMGHIPLLLQGAPRRALFLGIGTGATASAVRSFSSLEHVDAVELVPAVVDELDEFDDINAELREDPRVHLHRADARRFVAASREQYDVVVADLFHPGQDGAGTLYAREHFAAIAVHLAPGGLFAQWLPLYQLDDATLRTIVATFVDVFDDGEAWLGLYNAKMPVLALVARGPGSPSTIDVASLQRTLAESHYLALQLDDVRELLANRMLDREGLRALAGDAPLNTDLQPRVMLAAPRVAYEGMAGHGAANLGTLLELRSVITADRLGIDEPARTELHAEVERFGDALAQLLRTDIARQGEDQLAPPSEAVIAGWLAAYARAPEILATEGMLKQTAASRPELAERILPPMLERTPEHVELWKLWLRHLQYVGDTERLESAMAEAQARFGTPDVQSPG